MFFEAVDLYRTLHLKSTPMNSSHFQNNTKRTKNCPVIGSNMNDPSKRRTYWRYHCSVTYVTLHWRSDHEKFSFIVT